MDRMEKITALHTLGPMGTNCEAAAHHWFNLHRRKGRVFLYQTLEQTVEEMPLDENSALLGCIVYPKLHQLVFKNLARIRLIDCFVMKTLNMVLATRDTDRPKTITTHPAPESLVNVPDARIIHANSNSQAAIDCANGLSDGCITTVVCARDHSLKIITDFGRIEMGFTIHAPAVLS